MMPQWMVVMKKELVEALRDKRTLNMLLMFVFMYPAMVGFLLPRAAPGAMIYTDDWAAYAALTRRGRGHAAVNQLTL